MTTEPAEHSAPAVTAPPKRFWIVAGLGLIWNLMGVAAFVGQMTMDVSALPEAERAFYAGVPGWATTAFAIAVGAGVLGCIALLVRKRWALPLFIASLLGVLVQSGHSLLIGDGLDVFGPAGLVLPVLTLSIAAALVALARHAIRRGWLGGS